MFVVGSGMAGLLASAMLRDGCNRVFEAQENIPNNHSAVLRFRSSIVGDVLNIRFKKVQALKVSEPFLNPAADAMMYSKKVTGTYALRSIISANGEMNERYIAPPDLIQRMYNASMARFHFDHPVGEKEFFEWFEKGESVISTLPMPTLMRLLQYPGPMPKEFPSRSGTNINLSIPNCDSYCSLYVPDPATPIYRISLTGERMTIECAEEVPEGEISNIKADAFEKMGFSRKQHHYNIQVSRPKYSKILPIDDRVRKQFIMWATERYNVYSLGRFATWRPGLLLDDVVNDVRIIQKIHEEGGYDHRK